MVGEFLKNIKEKGYSENNKIRFARSILFEKNDIKILIDDTSEGIMITNYLSKNIRESFARFNRINNWEILFGKEIFEPNIMYSNIKNENYLI